MSEPTKQPTLYEAVALLGKNLEAVWYEGLGVPRPPQAPLPPPPSRVERFLCWVDTRIRDSHGLIDQYPEAITVVALVGALVFLIVVIALVLVFA